MHVEWLTATVAVMCVALSARSIPSQEHPGQALAHTRTGFRFTVNAPLEQAAPLFGADEERRWAPGWEPEFVYPQPTKDQQGSVFRIEHGQNSSVWTTTAFDLTAGHVQYVYLINDVMVTLIDIRLTHEGSNKTGVSVVYERTALKPEANEHVMQSAKQDEGFGTEWEEQINGYLQKSEKR